MRLNQRQKEADRALERILKDSENQLGRQYALALREIRSEIATMYSKLRRGEEPTLAAMSRYNNLDNRMKSISKELTVLFRGTKSTTFNMMETQYLEAHFREVFNLEYQAQRRLGFGKVNPKVIEEALNDPISGRSLDSRFIRNRRRLLESIEEGITQGLIRGESYREMAKRISDVMDKDMNRALMTARTEAHRIQTKGRLHAYETAERYGAEIERVWDATLDTDTRSTHQSMDGQVADENGMFTNENGDQAEGPGLFGDPSEDINCRCSVRARVKGYEDNNRRARVDGERGGKSEIVQYETYEEWYKERIES